jgi:hypothetical protein
MNLIADWKLVLQHSYAVKFSIVSALLTGAEVAVQFLNPTTAGGNPNIIFAVLAGLVSMLAIGARVLAQKELTNATKP